MDNALRIDAAELRILLRERRIGLGLSVRQAARAAGVPHTTFSRVVRGENVPDRDNLVLLLKWIGVPLEQLTLIPDDVDKAAHELTTPESVARVLLADKKLTPEDVDLLMAQFRAVYERLLKRNDEQVTSDLETQLMSAK